MNFIHTSGKKFQLILKETSLGGINFSETQFMAFNVLILKLAFRIIKEFNIFQ